LGIKGYPWYILSHPKPVIATKIIQGYINLFFSKMRQVRDIPEISFEKRASQGYPR
jgi:hypothetical protein